MSVSIPSLDQARVRRGADRLLALQARLDDTPAADAEACARLESELEALAVELRRGLARLGPGEPLAWTLRAALDARARWRAAEGGAAPRGLDPGGEAREDAADVYTLALIELALRLRGVPPRARWHAQRS